MHIEEFTLSATEPDWQRKAKPFFAWNPSRSMLASIRSYQRWRGRGIIGALFSKFAVVRHRFWSVVCGCDIPINTRIGGGLLLPHPNSVVIHPQCSIGPNCLIFQQVTLGHNSGRAGEGVPVVGGHVDIGAGAKILGPISIGDHAVIGANAVVLCDVPEYATAVGIPAKVVSRNIRGRDDNR
jgi:serine O-acetyltransferase